MAADGRGLRDVTINDKFAQFSEALFTADRVAREEVTLRNQMKQKLAEKENLAKEEHLREMARRAREERAKATKSRRRDSSQSELSSRSPSPQSDDSAVREREQARRERKEENERQYRQSRMGTEMKMKMAARELNRDISEKVALGLAKPTSNKETMYDSRLFNQSSGFDSGFNEDNPYDKPLFAAQGAIDSIYRPKATEEDYEEDEAESTMGKINKGNRFEALGKVKEGQGFKGSELSKREEGPVMFERDKDEFGIDSLIGEVKDSIGKEAGERGTKRYGLNKGDDGDERERKRTRVEDDDD